MKATVTFQELSDCIFKFTGKSVKLSCVQSDTVRVSYGYSLLGFPKTVSIDLTVMEVDGADVTMAYSGGYGVELLADALLKFVKNAEPDSMSFVHPAGGNTLKIRLSDINGLEKVLEHAELEMLRFDQEGLTVNAKLLIG